LSAPIRTIPCPSAVFPTSQRYNLSTEMKRRDTGILGEKLARDFLKKRGYRIWQTNYRCPEGEIDIVAKHRDSLVFVEVRTKRSLDFGSPEESITPVKKERMKATAARYRQTHDNLPLAWRIDVVVVELDKKGKLSRIELIENAVSED
jgi:putative endonuclease